MRCDGDGRGLALHGMDTMTSSIHLIHSIYWELRIKKSVKPSQISGILGGSSLGGGKDSEDDNNGGGG
jgi:hypothetical protein